MEQEGRLELSPLLKREKSLKIERLPHLLDQEGGLEPSPHLKREKRIELSPF